MLTRRERQPDTFDSTSRAHVMIGVLIVALAAAAVGTAAWTLFAAGGERDGIQTQGDLAPVGEAVPPVPRQPHPLLAPGDPVAWATVRDGRALGREASTVLEDAQTVLGSRSTSRGAVPAAQVSANSVAWASPRSLRLVNVDTREVTAWIGACDRGIDAVLATDTLLVTAACGRLTAVGAKGRTRWSVPLAQADAQRAGSTLLLRHGDAVIASVVGSRSVMGVSSSDGTVTWRHRTPDPVRLMEMSGADGVVVATAPGDPAAGGHAKVRRISTADGSRLWDRQWRGWRATALASDGARVVVALAQDEADTGCTPSGLAELASADGAARVTRRADARVVVRDMRVDPLTGRLVTMSVNRGCTVLSTDPRVDVYGARGLVRLHQVPLPARPCSPLAVAGGLAVAATCSEVLGIDTRNGQTAVQAELTDAPRRRSVAAMITRDRLVATDDVGSLQVIERRAAS